MSKRKAKRIFRDLTDDERARIATAREQANEDRKELEQRGRINMKAHRLSRAILLQLKELREKKSLSLSDLQEIMHMSRENICKLENDLAANPTVRTLVRYAEAVGLELAFKLDKKPLMDAHKR